MGRRLSASCHPYYPKKLLRECEEVTKNKETYQFNQQQNVNSHHTQELPILDPGDGVWIRDQHQPERYKHALSMHGHI